jgi:hypothetical protein
VAQEETKLVLSASGVNGSEDMVGEDKFLQRGNKLNNDLPGYPRLVGGEVLGGGGLWGRQLSWLALGWCGRRRNMTVGQEGGREQVVERAGVGEAGWLVQRPEASLVVVPSKRRRCRQGQK